MDAQTELHGAVISARSDSDAEQRYFGQAPIEEIRRELKHHGVPVEEITASLRAHLVRRIAELKPSVPSRRNEPAERYLQVLPSIERIAAFVARRGRMDADEIAEFVDVVRIRLFENDYAILRKFDGRTNFTNYLATVINHIFRQYRTEQWGKWRPSGEAKRMGEKAIVLERLLTRDGYTFDEAVNTLTIRSHPAPTRAELEAIYERLPVRTPRPVLVSTETFPERPSTDSADQRVEQADRERVARAVAAALDDAFQQLSAEERVILQMRFWQGMKVPAISRVLRFDQKKLYKQIDMLFKLLRRSLENAGIDRSVIEDLIEHPVSDFALASMPERLQTASDVKPPA